MGIRKVAAIITTVLFALGLASIVSANSQLPSTTFKSPLHGALPQSRTAPQIVGDLVIRSETEALAAYPNYTVGPWSGHVGVFIVFVNATNYYTNWTADEKAYAVQRTIDEMAWYTQQQPDGGCITQQDVINYATIDWTGAIDDPYQGWIDHAHTAHGVPYMPQLCNNYGMDTCITMWWFREMPGCGYTVLGTGQAHIDLTCTTGPLGGNAMVAHEAGHTMGACDQYLSAPGIGDCNTSCWPVEWSDVLNPWSFWANGNSEKGQPDCPSNISSVMRNNGPTIDAYMKAQIGWVHHCNATLNPVQMPLMQKDN